MFDGHPYQIAVLIHFNNDIVINGPCLGRGSIAEFKKKLNIPTLEKNRIYFIFVCRLLLFYNRITIWAQFAMIPEL